MKKLLPAIIFLVMSITFAHGQILFSTTSVGGNARGGTINKITPATKELTIVKNFEAPASKPYYTNLIQAKNGKLYGMTSEGGSSDAGVIFSFDPSASSYIILKNFDIANGGHPYGSLVQASNGKLYGMTKEGGSSDEGVIFSFDPGSLTYTKLKDFGGAAGRYPYGSLIQAGNGLLYGMTNEGGSSDMGVIFSFDPASSIYKKLKDFDGTSGAYPYGSLNQASNGKLYGMTVSGGTNYAGVIFSFDPSSSSFIILKNLVTASGTHPYGSLIQASDGKLYGVTNGGGSDDGGVIFSFNPSSSKYTKLKDFTYNYSGDAQTSSLMQANNGKLYGMTDDVIFSYDRQSSTYTELKKFEVVPNYYSHNFELYGSLMQAKDGKLYGMTTYGGINDNGTIFSIDLAPFNFTTVKDLSSNADGSDPLNSLLQASDKKLYGVTYSGGNNGYGVIFSFDPSLFIYKKLKDFEYIDGAHSSELIQASNGKLYGVTAHGGSNGFGVIFSFDPSSSTYKKLKDFDSTGGSHPFCGLIQANNGKLYGITQWGGRYDNGVIFSFDPVTSAYKKLKDFNNIDGFPTDRLIQASNGKLYGITSWSDKAEGTIFSFDPNTSTYTKLHDLNFEESDDEISYPIGGLIQASDGKLYGRYALNGDDAYNGGIYTFDPATSAYNNLDVYTDYPGERLMQASDGKLYGTTGFEAEDVIEYGTIFSFDPISSAYSTLKDFDYTNGAYPYSALIEVKGCIGGTTYYRDADGDGYGNSAISVTGCPIPDGYVAKKGDCNDDPGKGGAAIHPGAAEICNGIDDDCDGKIDAATLEAEDAALYDATVITGQPGYTGSGYAHCESYESYIEWTVNAATAGPFSLQFRYANGGTADRRLRLTINGVTVAPSFPFSPTGGWGIWSVASAYANLIAGVNKIRLTTRSYYSPNIDNLTIQMAECHQGTLEAEEALTYGVSLASNHTGFTGSGFTDFIPASGGFVEWNVNTTAAGSYSLQFRYANGTAINRPLKLEVNGVVVMANIAFPSTGGWTNWSVVPAAVNLLAGTNKVRLTPINADGPNLDHLKVEIVTGTLEAEQAILNKVAIATDRPGFTGTGFGDYVNASEDFIEWTVNYSTSASYSLQFRYANGGGANRPLKLEVNGVVVAATQPFSPTGSWATWSVSSATVSLTAGINKIRLTAIGFNGPNVDHLKISNVSSALAVQQKPMPDISELPVSPAILRAFVAPNPVEGSNAKLKVTTSSELPLDLQVVDMLGRIYKSLRFLTGRSNTFDFPVNDLPAGVYSILLKQGNLSTHTRLVVGGRK